MGKSSNARSASITFFGLLAIVFITLKLTNQIDWSWLWVLAPLWGPVALIIAIGVLAISGGMIERACETPRERHARLLKKAFEDYRAALTRQRR